MSATPNSPYQAIATKHAAGIPTGADPQRPNENFQEYFNRMACFGFSPDIGANESDTAYLARLASYVPAPEPKYISSSYAQTANTASQGAFAWGNFIYNSGNGTLTSSVYTCSISRSSTGIYPINFNNSANITNYAVICQGVTGSAIPSTGSLQCQGEAKSTTGFSFYSWNITTVGVIDTLALNDVTTASFVIFSY